jgi:hypothetical protein
MNQPDFKEARKAEASYHSELYSEKDILEPGTWMSRPVPIVMEMLERPVPVYLLSKRHAD